MKDNSKVTGESEFNKAELLYRIAKAMAAVKDGRELLKIIVEETQPVFGFYDIGLAILDKSGDFFVDWSVYYAEINPSKTNQIQRASNIYKFAVDEPLMKYSIDRAEREKKPFIENMTAEFVEKFKDFPHLPLEIEYGFKQFLVTTLKFGGETLGVLNFNSLRENHFENCDFELFQAIADLVAVAVANIRANEEIFEHAREKDVLLSISQAIATIQNHEQLFKVIFERIQPIFGFHDVGLFVFSNDGTQITDWAAAYAEISPSAGNRQIKQFEMETLPFGGSPLEYVSSRLSAAKLPVIFSYDEMLANLKGGLAYTEKLISVVKSGGYREFLATTLKSGGITRGLLFFNSQRAGFFQPAQFAMFQTVADQLAVAVSNILANNEIIKQLAEITDLKKRLEAENKYLAEEVGKNYNFEEIVGTSPRLMQVFEVIETVAPTDATVLIQGETGTGKELIARAVHSCSARNARPLIKINCAALPRELIESELFGHERGSFTGAHEKRLGKFELADKGTIFLDEIGELPLDAQVKLLRVLQEKEIERLGGKGTIKLDLRVVAATNRNLASEVRQGRFRADLYYRLCTVELFMPALRERREDIEPLTMYFAQKYAAKFSRRIERISMQMLAELYHYDFPGNIRELEHIVEHAVIFSKSDTLILPRSLTGNGETQNAAYAETIKPPKNAKQTLESVERDHIINVLRQTSGRIKGKNGAAEILGLNPATVYFRLKKLGIEK